MGSEKTAPSLSIAVWRQLGWHTFFNATCICLFALFHPYVLQELSRNASGLASFVLFELVFIESLLLVIPAF